MPHETTAVPTSDEELAREAQQGSVAGFEQLVRRYQVSLLHFLQQWTGPGVDPEDLVQDTFVRAYENLHRYQASRRFSTWLFTIARRISINQQRKKRPIADSEAVQSVKARDPEPETAVADEEDRRRLWDMAAKILSQQQVTAMWLYYVEEMPIREIARVLDRSRTATKTMLFRARKELLPTLQESESGHRVNVGRTPPGQSSCRTAMEVPNG